MNQRNYICGGHFIVNQTVLCIILLAGIFVMTVHACPKGVIVVRPLDSEITITIDGNFDDWPLSEFGDPAMQPLFPEGQDNETTDARGEWVIYDPDRVGFFNTARGAVSEDDDAIDFEASTYFAYDSEYLYIVSIIVDDDITNYRDETEFGSGVYLNDGQEYFFDALNDSDDCIAELVPWTIDTVEPNLDDFQIATGLNDLFDPVLPNNEEGLGISSGAGRAGNLALLGTGDFSDGLYQVALQTADGPLIAAKAIEDLRAAGAPNPVIAENPNELFTGYVIEHRIPFDLIDEFTPDHSMGFTIFWRDVDALDNGNTIQFIDWAQSTTANTCLLYEDAISDIFYAPNWGTLEFNTDHPLGNSTKIQQWNLFK